VINFLLKLIYVVTLCKLAMSLGFLLPGPSSSGACGTRLVRPLWRCNMPRDHKLCKITLSWPNCLTIGVAQPEKKIKSSTS